MGFKQSAGSIHKFNMGFSALKIVIAIALIGVSFTVITAIEKSTTFGDVAWFFKLAKNAGIVTGVAVIVIEALGIISYVAWNKGLNITFIVLASVSLLALAGCGTVAAVPAAGTWFVCHNVTANCYICPYATEAACYLPCAASPKTCCALKSDMDTLCEQALPKLWAVLALIFALVMFMFIGAVIGCCACGYIGRFEQGYSPVATIMPGGSLNF